MDAIAIIGMGCRFPGAKDPQSFWHLMRNGVDAITEVPPDRWNIDTFYDPEPATPGKMSTRYGGFLDNVDQFEPSFFGISSREAKSIDPQQRLVLEVAWEALENAGMMPEKLSGSRTGVFIGISGSDYDRLGCNDFNRLDAYSGTGTGLSIAANRLSHVLNLRGPSIAIDTACSSSLVSVHLACQSLQRVESNLCLAGGVNLMVFPGPTITCSQARMIAPDGRCKTFDASADGYVRGEGCGIVVLKRLSDALRDGDNILAIIKGSAINQDGLSNGLTAPNGPSQQMVIREALENAGVAPAEISYVETHGTGTSLGDPIEVKSLKAVLMQGREPNQPCWIGSVKTNIGHLEAAAGIAGLIKVVLSLQHREIPPHLHLKQLSPYISLQGTTLSIPTERQPWTAATECRLAGVSAFSFGGTNCHVILEEAPVPTLCASEISRPLHLLTLSAKSDLALGELAQSYADFLASHPDASLADICFTANTGRSHFDHRLCVVIESTMQLRSSLEAFAANRETDLLVSSQVQSKKRPKIAFLFANQGYVGIGRQLYFTQPTFRHTLDRCNEILRPYLEKPLLEVLDTQIALFAIEYALAELWKSWGIKPSIVMGHGVGEYVAACVAGIFSLEDGLKLIASRAGLIKTTFEQVAADVAYSFPRIEVISNLTGGPATAEIATAEYWCRHLHRGRGALVQGGAEEQGSRGAEGKEENTPGAMRLQAPLFIYEVSPLPLCPSAPLPLEPSAPLPLHDRDWQVLLHNLRELYLRGVAVDWSGFDRDYPRRLLQLPTYPFQRQRYWAETAILYHKTISLSNNGARSKILHPLLGQRIHSALKEIQFESQISQDAPAFLEHHRIYQTAIAPATAYLEMALAAGAAVFKSDNLVLEQVVIQQALILPEEEGKTLQLILTPEGSKASYFQIFSLTTDEENSEPSWTLHACGKVLEQGGSCAEGQRGSCAEGQRGGWERELPLAELATLQTQYAEEISVKDYYQEFRKRGIDYGSSFQAIERLWRHDGKALGEIRLPEELIADAGDYQLHPVLLDACFQILAATLSESGWDELWVPVGLERLCVYSRTTTRLWSHVQMRQVLGSNQQTLTADLHLFDVTGDVVAQVEGLSVKRASREALVPCLQQDLSNWLYEIVWQPKDHEHNLWALPTDEPGSWLILTDNGGIGQKLASMLQQWGDRCVLVSPGPAYEMSEAEYYHINPNEPENFQRLLQESLGDNHPPCRGVVHLWSLEGTPQETTITSLQHAQTLGCGSTLHLVQALTQAKWSKLPRLVLVTRDAVQVETAPVHTSSLNGGEIRTRLVPLQVQHAPLWGLGRVIALEHPEMQCLRLDLGTSGDRDEIQTLFEELWSTDKEDQVAYSQGIRHVARLVNHTTHALQSQLMVPATEPFQLKISSYGLLDNLTLTPSTRRQLEPGEVEIQVCATGLNFRDVLNALGMLREYAELLGISAADIPFGFECAGKIVALGEDVFDLKVGDEVIAAMAIGSFSSFVTVKAEFVVPKPEVLSFEEAATIPTAFLTAYYGLHTSAKIQPGDRVLIHAAAGGVGLAAVQLAQRAGAEVFGTASPSKWEVLKSLGVEHVMNSRTLDFAEEVMALTKGQGVDIVLNCLNGEFIPKSLSVLRQEGRFVEIGKIGIWDQSQVQQLRSDVSYFPFDLGEVAQSTPSLIAPMLRELMAWFKQGTLKPLPHQVFPLQDVVSAFRYMAQAKHIGKVVVSQSPTAWGDGSPDKKPMRSDSSYLITGGLGGLGLLVAKWMVEQGVRHLVLTGRSGIGAAHEAISQLQQAGAQVLVVQADVSNQEAIARLLEQVKTSMPPLLGIVHAAGLLDDGVLRQLDWERFARVMAPKVEGTWNLHVLTQEMPLDFFVCFSSVASLLGSPGQGNYAAANAFMDALAHHRRALGLPGLSINWGPWAVAGMAAQLGSRNRGRIADLGLEPIAPEQGLQVLAELLTTSAAQVGVLPVNWSKFRQQFSQGMELPLLEVMTGAGQALAQRSEFLQQLEAAPVKERRAMLMAHLRSQLAKVLDLSTQEQIEPRQRLFDLGLDSLMAVELKNHLESTLACSLRSTLVFDYPTVEALVDYLATEVLSVEFSSASGIESQKNSEAIEPAWAELEELSESGAEALLLKELEKINY